MTELWNTAAGALGADPGLAPGEVDGPVAWAVAAGLLALVALHWLG
jgi:hypothetical protein